MKLENYMGNWYNVFKEHFIKWSAKSCSCLVIIIVLGIIISSILIFVKPRVDKIYSQNYVVNDLSDVALTAKEKYNLEQLISKNKIISASTIYDKTLNYYDSLISVLGFLIAFLGIFVGLGAYLSYVSMKGKIKDTIDDEIKSQFTNIFFQDHLRALIEEKLAEEMPDWLKSKENTTTEIIEQVKNELEKNKRKKLNVLVQTDNTQSKKGGK
jgi:predicted house-cleaning noncanonical NTP pyrophosphatase (MazG superfamily)